MRHQNVTFVLSASPPARQLRRAPPASEPSVAFPGASGLSSRRVTTTLPVENSGQVFELILGALIDFC